MPLLPLLRLVWVLIHEILPALQYPPHSWCPSDMPDTIEMSQRCVEQLGDKIVLLLAPLI